ncbi:MAG: glycosyltransferase family 4 protein [bacterium]
MRERALYIYEGKLTRHGIDAVVRQQLQALAECGLCVDLVSRGDPGLEGVSFRGMRWTPANALSWLPRSIYYPAQKRFFSALGSRLAKRGDYSKIISWRDRARQSFQAGKNAGAECYLNHDSMHWIRSHAAHKNPRWPAFSREEMNEEYRLADAILLPSQNSFASFQDQGIPGEKLCVIGRGVDTDTYRPSQNKRGDVFRLVFCGRVGERKGIRQVVEAWKQAALTNAELLVIGQIDEDVDDLVEENRQSNIRWMGFRTDLAEILPTCQVQILLSRNEGMAKSLLEGAACGLATIATADCGFPLQEGVNGFLVQRTDLNAVAALLKMLQRNPDRCAEIGGNGRRTVEERYSWSAFRKRFADALKLIH